MDKQHLSGIATESLGSGHGGVWECGSVGVWECGSVGVWECGSVGVWECGSVGVWECKLFPGSPAVKSTFPFS